MIDKNHSDISSDLDTPSAFVYISGDKYIGIHGKQLPSLRMEIESNDFQLQDALRQSGNYERTIDAEARVNFGQLTKSGGFEVRTIDFSISAPTKPYKGVRRFLPILHK